ncbi:TIGR04282 family arsenosugar biosynthesis glycosyltransferase [Parerythrobacter lacustris]|uniref:TIGR04282 family arsenosugar biosynthesis glycosyltransferase n=1 Tax=Parerythrobacter lacustris TaxID=2969984 RepID=A0ABT1XR96_9SPHN|nr:TIGR04282 family arsenosugar biosynthesis glycosyltransferase [Parerythrobacter lacustris]MCR2834183.1 TIGR04282 family arsenosugar biosynthesis glycosyltransferase [Parerythrobacter lacustris]
MTEPRLSIFARWPEPGKAKTRLIPGLGAEGAAAVYAKLLAHTIEVARASGLDFELRVTGTPVVAFREGFGRDLIVVPQGEGELTDKLTRVPAPAIVIGSDCPGLTPQILQAARDTLANEAAVIGPASDGGYYLLGYNADARFAFADMPWSTPVVFEETVRRFAAKGIRPAVLPELADVDTIEDLADWPEFLP